MKKYFFMALVAFASIALVSCKKETNSPDGGDSSQTGEVKVVLSEHTLTVAVNQQEKLRAALNPSKEGVTVSFKSEDETIATVESNGLVTGVTAGTVNVIASAEGATSDTCVVTVIDAADAFAWGGIFLNREQNFKILNDKDTAIITLSDGTVCHCILVSGTGMMWDENIFLDNSSETGLVGEGYFAFIEDYPVYQIVDSIDDKGPNYWWVGAGSVAFVDADLYDPTDTAFAYCASAGKMGSAEQQLLWANDTTYEVESGIKGTNIWYMDASTFSGYPAVGLIGQGVVEGNTNEAFYRVNIGWYEDESLYGLKLVKGSDDKYTIKEPAEWASIEYKEYVQLPEESSAPRRRMARKVSNEKLEKTLERFKEMRSVRR